MTMTMAQVRAILDPEEPNYAKAAQLGAAAIPFLEQLIQGSDVMLAAKAAYAASLIQAPGAATLVKAATEHDATVVRVAAAAAARNLEGAQASEVLMPLIQDADVGVRKVALDSVGPDADVELRSQIEQLSTEEIDPVIRDRSAQTLHRLGLGMASPSHEHSGGCGCDDTEDQTLAEEFGKGEGGGSIPGSSNNLGMGGGSPSGSGDQVSIVQQPTFGADELGMGEGGGSFADDPSGVGMGGGSV